MNPFIAGEIVEFLRFLARLTFQAALAGAIMANAWTAALLFGFFRMLGTMLLFPITLLVLPVYAGVKVHLWAPFFITYGGMSLALALWMTAAILNAHYHGE